MDYHSSGDDDDLLSVGSENPSTVGENELPPIEDRKTFLTCLACILTSSYKYDVVEEHLPSSPQNTNPQEHEHEHENEDEDAVNTSMESATTYGSESTASAANIRGTENLSSDDDEEETEQDNEEDGPKEENVFSMFLEDEEEEEEDAEEVEEEDESSSRRSNDCDSSQTTNTTPNTNNNRRFGHRLRNRFGRNSANRSTNSVASTSTTISDASLNDSNNSGSGVLSSIRNRKNNRKKNQAQRRRQRKKRVTKAQQKLQLAATRHYKRRYVVADQCLHSSCELLLLDKELAQEIYTELEPKLQSLKSPTKILVATSIPISASATSQGGEKGGGGQGLSSSPSPGNSATTAISTNKMKDAYRNFRWNSGSGSDGSDGDDNENNKSESSDNNNGGDLAGGGAGGASGDGGGGGEGTGGNNTTTTKTPEDIEKEARQKQMQQQYLKQYEWMTEFDTELENHLPGLPPGAGYRCLCWLLFQHLLHATKRGYDSRVRYVFKSLAVAVLVQDIERTLGYAGDSRVEWKTKNYTTWVSFATRKFEQVEAAMASRLLKLAQAQQSNNPTTYGGDPILDNVVDTTTSGGSETAAAAVSLEDLEEEAEDGDIQIVSVKKNKKKLEGARKQLVRGLKIGGVGVVAGTLLAVTGGMAAPAIAGALTFLGMGAVAGTFLTLASTSAVVHLFGVAGGSLAAYKMRRRTAGLTEFKIVQSSTTAATSTNNNNNQDDSNNDYHNESDMLPEATTTNVKHPRLARWKEKAKAFKNRHQQQSNTNDNDNNGQTLPTKAELSRTVCISGWLTDKHDFQRPWGITPTKPPPTKLEKLQRFYRIYNPDLIPVCENLLKRWKREENTFWDLLEDKYGCNPDTLFPLKFGPMYDAALTEMEVKVLDTIIVEIGEVRGKEKAAKHAHLPEHVQSTIVHNNNNNSNHNPKDGGIGGGGGGYAVDSFDDAASLASFTDEKNVTIDNEGGAEEGGGKDEQQAAAPPQRFQRQCYASVFEQVAPSSSLEKLIPPAHLATVWDFSARYGGEVYSLHWETHMLTKLCQCFRDVALQATASAGQQALRLMIANTLYLAASVPIYVLQAVDSIDETWSVVVSRAEEAGQELARSLLINNAGHRPVTLLGYSFGARVVFSCLKQLTVYQQQWEEYHEQKNSRAIGFAQQEEVAGGKKPNRKEKKWMLAELEFEREPASVVEDVVLMGAPMYLSLSSWKACRQVVAGRLVNVYSRTDKILSLMFKYKQMMESFKPVVGNCTVAVPGVENIDVSDLVNNHSEYVLRLGDILKRVRHGQPIRSSSNALDEVALIAEAATIAKQQQLQQENASRSTTGQVENVVSSSEGIKSTPGKKQSE